MSEPGPDHGLGTLTLVPTPLGNLGDVSERMRSSLAGADVAACEDTRVTRRLYAALGISAPRLVAYSEHTHARAIDELLGHLDRGAHVIAVADAGMPAISDPGARLVAAARSRGHHVTAIPGPSSVPLAIALAGVASTRFCFVGFLPRTRSDLARVVGEAADQPIVAFESPRRLARTLEAIAEVDPELPVVACRELSKLHETVLTGTAAQVRAALGDEERGEVTLVLGPSGRAPIASGLPDHAVRLAAGMAAEGVHLKAACRLVAGELGLSARGLYNAVIAARDDDGTRGDS